MKSHLTTSSKTKKNRGSFPLFWQYRSSGNWVSSESWTSGCHGLSKVLKGLNLTSKKAKNFQIRFRWVEQKE